MRLLPRPTGIWPVPPREPVERPTRLKEVLNSGRRVGIEPATMPMPGSTVDQMATSRVASVERRRGVSLECVEVKNWA